MRERKPLKLNTELRFTNCDSGVVRYFVDKVVGVGGSCVVYDGYYLNNTGKKKTVRIKECYPYKLHISRADDNCLDVSISEKEKFEECKERLRESFKISNELFLISRLSNSIANTVDIYESNNTVYIVTSYVEGMVLSNYEIKSLKAAVKIVKSTAKSIDMIHNKGYLYLDIKPDNILIFYETPELIQLFDFDSIIPIGASDNISNYRISYSMGFAPIEQRSGNLSKVGICSEVYSVGALFYFLIFGKVPMALDCGFDADYDYSEMKWKNYYNDRLYLEITKFFHGTLQSYYDDRYHAMLDVIEQLTLIEKYADLSRPFIHSSIIPDNELCIGRDDELKKINGWMESDSRCLFISGMGGIGKSTLVRKYIFNHKSDFENVVYIYCNETMCNVIANDEQLFINTCEKSQDETNSEYSIRKMKVLKSLEIGTDVILVLDNFDGVMDEYVAKIIDIGWKVIAVTRKDMSGFGYPVIYIGEIKNNKCLQDIFSVHLGQRLSNMEYGKIEKIILFVAGHTLSLELIAKQIAKSYLTIDEAFFLAENNGFYNMVTEKVEIVKDGKRFYERVSALIQAIYNVNSMNVNKQKILKLLSLFDTTVMDIKELKNLMQLDAFDDINELKELGWIYATNEGVYLHPLIQETIHHLEWNDTCREITVHVMCELLKAIKVGGKKETYHPKLQDNNKKLKHYVDSSNLARKIVEKFANKKGILGEITLDRIESCDDSIQINYRLLQKKIRMARAVINNCSRDQILSKNPIYKDLMFVTVINMSKDQENYILKYADMMIKDKDCKKPYTIMELYDYVVYIYCQTGDFEAAKCNLEDAYLFAKKQSNNYLWGLYYDMLMDFYEAVLDGAYDFQTEHEEQLLRNLLDANEKAIYYMSKSKYDIAKGLLAKYIIGKAALLIRSYPDEVDEIRKLISNAKPLIEQYTLEHSEVRSIYYMTWAWYYTLCEPNDELVLNNLENAQKINAEYGMSELDEIDYYYIPAANMMCELDKCKQALELLSESIAICDQHTDMLPFMRKKLDLLSYELDVYYGTRDMNGCKMILKLIDIANEQNSIIGINKEISVDLRKEIESY